MKNKKDNSITFDEYLKQSDTFLKDYPALDEYQQESIKDIWWCDNWIGHEPTQIKLGFKKTKDNPEGLHTLTLEYYVNKFEKKLRKLIKDNKKAYMKQGVRQQGFYYTQPIPKLLPLWDDIKFLEKIQRFYIIHNDSWDMYSVDACPWEDKREQWKDVHPFYTEIDQRLMLLALQGQYALPNNLTYG